MPSLTGASAGDAEADDTVRTYNWKIRTVSEISDQEPGTVTGQSPKEGAKLASGRSITVRVANKAPAKPKTWVSILSLQGQGSKRTDEFRIPDGVKVRVKYSFSGDSNDIIQIKDPDEGDDSFGDLVINEIGPKSGTTRLYGAAGTVHRRSSLEHRDPGFQEALMTRRTAWCLVLGRASS